MRILGLSSKRSTRREMNLSNTPLSGTPRPTWQYGLKVRVRILFVEFQELEFECVALIQELQVHVAMIASVGYCEQR
jgi:hypothetical protein